MDEGTAEKYHFQVGDTCRILLTGPTQTFMIRAIVQLRHGRQPGRGHPGGVRPADRASGARGARANTTPWTSWPQPGANKAALQQSIAAVLPTGVEVVTGQTVANESANQVNQALSFFSTALLVFAFISLFVGGLHHLQHVLDHRRASAHASWRCCGWSGASRRQMFRSVLAEAAIVGLVASLIGLGLGVLTRWASRRCSRPSGSHCRPTGSCSLPGR